MFREMVRKKQQLSREETMELLKQAPRGILSVLGDDGYPYGVPIDHWYNEEDGRIYFHSGKEGHKIDAIRREEKASFCVIDQDKVVSEEYTTHFRSVIAFGRVHILEGEEEKRNALRLLAGKYSAEQGEAGIEAEIDKSFANVCMLQFDLEHVTGKEAIELVKMR